MKILKWTFIFLLTQNISFGQSKGDLLLSGFFSPGYSIHQKYSGIGGQLGLELTYNFTEKVPFSVFGGAEIFNKMFIVSGGFRVAHLYYLKDDTKFLEFRGTLGGSSIFGPEDDFPGMGIRLGLALHYRKLLSENICYYIGPGFSASLDGMYDAMFATLDFGLGYYIW